MAPTCSSVRATAVLLAGLLALGTSVARLPAAEPEATGKKTVRLAIDFGDGVELHFSHLQWREGLTVADALKLASAHKRGVPVKSKGSGATTLVVQIGDLANEGGGREAKNWLFYVNDDKAEVGAGAFELKPGQRVLWKFAKYE